ncbi:MAG: AMP-binding protein [Vicinamibacteria bacterium]|nr:AMP-binding protein [Vicinamibacteria bacterium]
MTPPLTHDMVTLHRLMGELARAEADRVALIDDDGSTTYSEMWARAEAIAGTLRSRGVQRGDVVAVAMPRSSLMVTACVAVMRTGAIVLALDLKQPALRNRRFLEAGRVRFSVTEGPAIPECVAGTEAIEAHAAAPPRTVADADVGAEDPGFVVFTSGTSGEPKGVLISHAAMVARSRVEQAAFGLTASDLYLLRTSPMLIGLPVALEVLASGVPLRISPEAAADDASGLADLIRDSRITFAGFPPRLIESLLAVPELAAKLASLRVLRSSGEALRPRLAARVRAALPGCRVVDGYGTTETGGIVLTADVEEPVDLESPALAGRPLGGVAVRLVDEEGASTAEGDIHVSTPMLSSGYLDGGAEDGARFVFAPGASEEPLLRWYRTGDRGRRLPDGRIMVLRRLDVQLNVDGVRIDPVEVESALRAHPSVRDAAVWTHPDGQGRARLIAYIVHREAPTAPAELRSFLTRSLPSSLIPARFVHLDALPLTSSGKVDRARLPPPGSLAERASPARDEGESRVLALFREILDVPGLGINDDFFEWGGDSVKAFALMARISERIGVRLPAATILTAPTAAALAREIAQGDTGQVTAIRLRRAGDLPPLVCLPGLAGDPLWFRPLLEALDRAQPVIGLSFVGLKPPFSIKTAALRGIDALRGGQPAGPYLLLGHSVGGVLAFEMARELRRQGGAVAFLGLIDTWVPGSRRVAPSNAAARVAKRLKRFRNRMVGAARDRLQESLARLGVEAEGRRGPIYVPGLREAALVHRLAPCDLAITLFRANERTLGADLATDWAPFAQGGVEIVDIAGHHFNLITGGRARELSARIAAAVARALTSWSRESASRSR